MKLLRVSLGAVLLLAACTTTAPVSDRASDTPSTGEAERMASSLMAMQIPEGSMLRKSYADWVAYHNSQPEQMYLCDAQTPLGHPGVETLWITDHHVVAKILCHAGSDQSSYVFYNIDNAGPQENIVNMSFDVFDEEGARTRTGILADARFDLVLKQLTMHSKQRGATDCGSSATYEWREDIGGFFDLIEFRQKLDCDGQKTEFPIIYTRGAPGPAEGQSVE